MVTRKEAIQALKKDPVLFFNKQCYITNAAGKKIKLNLNPPQIMLQNMIDKQLKEKGKVRISILKARKQGFSTFISIRGLHKACYNKNVNVKTMAHLHSSTIAIFQQMKYTYNNINDDLKPKDTANNLKKLFFGSINSGLDITTAGSGETGRGETFHFFHGSEVAFWQNAAKHGTGIINALPDVEGTECYLESTACGMVGDGEFFYNKVMNGLDNNTDDDFETLFIPWFASPEYITETPPDFALMTHSDWCEKDYKATYNLTDEQIYWMRKKIQSSAYKKYGDFCIEYPANPIEAFEGSGEDSFIEPSIVSQARKRDSDIDGGEIALGIDVGGDKHSSDRSVICLRVKNAFKIIWEQKGIERDELIQVIAGFVEQYNPHRIRIDITGIGYNIDKSLIKLCNMRNIAISDCQGVDFGSGASDSNRFVNQRAEMYHHLRETLLVGSCDDSAMIQKELTSLRKKPQVTGLTRIQLMPKKDLTESPDRADAMALCCHQSKRQFTGLIC